MSGVVAANMPQGDMLKTHNSESSDVNLVEDETDRPIAPSATPAASRGTEQPRPGTTVCQNCLTTTTPLWRRDENGQILCNACGLFFKLHGRRRPISLKTDVIKSRNRSRNTSLGRRSHPKRPRVASSSPRASSPDKQRSASAERQQYPSAAASTSVAQPSSLARGSNSAPGPDSAPPAVAPQPSPQPQQSHTSVVPSPYTFDPSQQQPTPVRTPQGSFPLPSISRSPAPVPSPPNIQLVRGSMSELLLPRSPPEGLERVPPLQHISASELHEKTMLPGIRPAEPVRNTEEVNKELTTRVSELELVNDLLKRRIADLEFSENQARRTAMEAQQTAENLWKQLTALKAEKNDA